MRNVLRARAHRTASRYVDLSARSAEDLLPCFFASRSVDLLRSMDAIEAGEIFGSSELGFGLSALLRVPAQARERGRIETAAAEVALHPVTLIAIDGHA